MLKIAYCDDQASDRQDIAEALVYVQEQCDQKFEISEFSTGHELCKSIESNCYDVILLDILMKNMDGITVASNLRATRQDFFLIFISNYDKRLKELFKFNTTAYLDKPLDKELFLQEFKSILESEVKKFRPVLAFTCNRSKMYVGFRDILMVESHNHQVILHSTQGTYTINEKLKNIWERLKLSKAFVFPNRTAILNMSFSSMDSPTLFTVPALEKSVNVGRTKKESTMERYLDFIGD